MRRLRRENLAPTDRRKATRYEQGLPASFRWVDGAGTRIAYGTCRDLSCEGAFVVTNVVPGLGTTVTVEIRVPLPAPSSRNVRFSGKGIVARVDRGEGEGGFAISGHFNLKRAVASSRGQDGPGQARVAGLVEDRQLTSAVFAAVAEQPKSKAN